MSAINFTSRAGTVQVLGSERYHLVAVVQALAGVGEGGNSLPTADDLNACLRVGTDAAILAARLTGQVELVLWVDGPNRAWLANIIEQASGPAQALANSCLRPEAGWPMVVHHLQQSAEHPLFIWATGGRPFPNPEGWLGSADEWQGLGLEQQWFHTEATLRQESAQEDATSYLAGHPTLVAAPFSRELRPSNWSIFHFAELVTA
jgi:hypothetical protein